MIKTWNSTLNKKWKQIKEKKSFQNFTKFGNKIIIQNENIKCFKQSNLLFNGKELNVLQFTNLNVNIDLKVRIL